jgi:uncharacterized protein (DUF486 family)
MLGAFYLIAGIALAILGAVLWWRQTTLLNHRVFVSIALILLGAAGIVFGLERLMHLFQKPAGSASGDAPTWREWVFIIGLIFVGSLSYTVAAYYHLKLEHWSFVKAFAIALPLILIEYQFSIRGNYEAKNLLKMNAVQITIMTMSFYFINAWMLNYFFLKAPVIWWREMLAFACILLAFFLTTSVR